jgi:hypothetical protein
LSRRAIKRSAMFISKLHLSGPELAGQSTQTLWPIGPGGVKRQMEGIAKYLLNTLRVGRLNARKPIYFRYINRPKIIGKSAAD